MLWILQSFVLKKLKYETVKQNLIINTRAINLIIHALMLMVLDTIHTITFCNTAVKSLPVTTLFCVAKVGSNIVVVVDDDDGGGG